MVYCDYTDYYLLKVSEYDLMEVLPGNMRCLKKQDEKSLQNQIELYYDRYFAWLTLCIQPDANNTFIC
jgi:hypothetical protein